MSVRVQPSEFGGTTQRSGIAPPITPKGHAGHRDLSAAEKVHLMYVTGQDIDTTRAPDNGESFIGILPLQEAIEAMPVQEKWIDANG